MKKIKPKSFLLLEILTALLLATLLIPPLIRMPLALYNSLKASQKALDLSFAEKVFIHDLYTVLQNKKTVHNGDEIALPVYRGYTRKAKIFYTYEGKEKFCTLTAQLFLKQGNEAAEIREAKFVVCAASSS